jgi:hypothetical protein
MRVGILVGLALLAVVPNARGADSPSVDPFYVPPPDLAQHAPGDILRTRAVQISLGPLPAGLTATSYQLLYRTNDAHNRATSTVTTVIVPNSPAPAGGRDLLSLQDATDANDIDCAPSYQLQIGSPDSANLQLESTIALAGVASGYTVVIPDHEGPHSQYIVKGMEGHATLDGVRAAERFDKAQLNGAKTPVALAGYSGGGHATASANELQPAYAPELNMVAVAAGGIPPANEATFTSIDGGVGTGVLLGVSIALNDAFPSFRLDELLNDKGKAFVEQYKKGCASSVFAAPFAHADDFTNQPGIIHIPRVARIIARNALGHATPTAPSLYYNGIGDELVHIEPLDALVAKYCSQGATIDYVRDPAGVEHVQAAALFIPQALAYIADRFAGTPAPNTCPPAAPSAKVDLRAVRRLGRQVGRHARYR